MFLVILTFVHLSLSFPCKCRFISNVIFSVTRTVVLRSCLVPGPQGPSHQTLRTRTCKIPVVDAKPTRGDVPISEDQPVPPRCTRATNEPGHLCTRPAKRPILPSVTLDSGIHLYPYVCPLTPRPLHLLYNIHS